MASDKLKAWIQASRPPFYIATLIPIVIGWVLASAHGWRPWRFVFVLLGSMVVHLVTNLSNDYFDHVVGADAGESIGGSRVIQEGKIRPSTLLHVIVLLYAVAFIVAFAAIVLFDLLGLLPFVLFAFFSSFFYVAPPFRYGYHGLGELFVALNMGPVLVVGTYWVVAGYPDWRPLFISFPIGLMVASILYFQSLPDMATDMAVGKRTLSNRLGKRRSLVGLSVFWLTIYAMIVALAAFGVIALPALLCLLTFPVFVRMIRVAKETGDWKELDKHGRYVRILYLTNGLAILAGIV